MKKEKKFPKELTGEVRRKIVLQKIAANEPYWTIVEELKEEWGIAEATAKQYIAESLKYLNSDEFKDTMKGINLTRLEQIITESMGSDNKTALKAIDLSQKAVGAYTEKIEIESDNEINITFNV